MNNTKKSLQKGFTLMEAVMVMFGLSLLLVILVSFFSVSLDQSAVVDIDSDLIRSEQTTKSWIKEDVERNYVKSITLDSLEELTGVEHLRILIEEKDTDINGNEVWNEKEIIYANKTMINGDKGFFRTVDGIVTKVSSYQVTEMVMNGSILELSFDYGDYIKKMKLKLEY